MSELRGVSDAQLRQVFVDSAGTSLPADGVQEAVKAHLDLEQQVGGELATEIVVDALTDTYAALSELLRCQEEEIGLFSSGMQAWMTGLDAVSLDPTSVIVATSNCFGECVEAYEHRAALSGCDVMYVEVDDRGEVNVDGIVSTLDRKIRLVAFPLVSAYSGTPIAVEQLTDLAHRVDAFTLADACQAIGQTPIDVRALGVDFLAFTGRKFVRGPRGTGGLYASSESLASLGRTAGHWVPDTARELEFRERSAALQLGLGQAARQTLARDVSQDFATSILLADTLRSNLDQMVGVEVDCENDGVSAVVTFRLTGRPASRVRQAFVRQNVLVGLARRSAEPLRDRETSLRAAFHHFNTMRDVEDMCSAVSRLLAEDFRWDDLTGGCT